MSIRPVVSVLDDFLQELGAAEGLDADGLVLEWLHSDPNRAVALVKRVRVALPWTYIHGNDLYGRVEEDRVIGAVSYCAVTRQTASRVTLNYSYGQSDPPPLRWTVSGMTETFNQARTAVEAANRWLQEHGWVQLPQASKIDYSLLEAHRRANYVARRELTQRA